MGPFMRAPRSAPLRVSPLADQPLQGGSRLSVHSSGEVGVEGHVAGGGAGQGAGGGHPHPRHDGQGAGGEDGGEGRQAVGRGVQPTLRHQPGGETCAKEEVDGGAAAVEEAHLAPPVDGAEGQDGGGREQHVHPVVGVVGQGQGGRGHLTAPPVHVQVGLAVKLLPDLGHVALPFHHVEVLSELLSHQLRENPAYAIKTSR